MTQLEKAKKGVITPLMRRVAEIEGVAPGFILEKIRQGKVVIPNNIKRNIKKPCGIGEGLKTKINANIGTSKDEPDLKKELKKLKTCIEAGADCVMDLSTGPGIPKIRKAILENSDVPVGTVPIYEAAINACKNKGSIKKMTENDLFKTIEQHAKDGVDFVTVHCGVTFESLGKLKQQKRVTNIVSRGGAFLVEWMVSNNKENPLYKNYDRLLEIAKKYDVTLSLGDGMRPGCLKDASDSAQIQELVILGKLAKKALKYGVQVIIEGPGHVPINQIASNVVLQKKVCNNAPFYVLGPLVTDIAPGYDHITGAIGGAIAAAAGADFLCYVTPSEHLRLPSLKDVKDGVIASRIAAHAADIAKGINGAMDWDIELSRARQKRDWKLQKKLSIDPEKFEEYRKSSSPKEEDVCTMCSDYCSMKLVESYLQD